jgi:predicted short-subunit dehydrogenase-like oxidoreductase (DUF2520 family)
MPTVRIIGAGRAGTALSIALSEVGWEVLPFPDRDADVSAAAENVDLLVLATPDSVISEVAGAVTPRSRTVVAHLAGSLGLEVLAPHPRRAAIHPLVALPDGPTGARRLRAGGWFAVAGDELASVVVADLGGRAFEVADEHRAAYHASAVVASNHLVALLGQAERIAATAGVPFEALLDLVDSTIANVVELGPAAALTGPAARGDQATIDRHLAVLADHEKPAYEALAEQAARLAGRRP